MKISIIIVTYNSSQFIHLCLDSILLQSGMDYELFIIEDQKTKPILESSILQHPIIQLDSFGNYQVLIYDRINPILIEIVLSQNTIQLHRFYHCACH